MSKQIVKKGFKILSTLTFGAMVVNSSLTTVLANENSAENIYTPQTAPTPYVNLNQTNDISSQSEKKKEKKQEKKDKQEKKKADFKITNNGDESNQLKKILISLANKYDAKNKVEIINNQTFSGRKKDAEKKYETQVKKSETVSKNDLKEAEQNIDSIIELETKKDDKNNTKKSYLYNNYIIQSDDINTDKKNDSQDINVEMRMLSMVEQNLYEMTGDTDYIQIDDTINEDNVHKQSVSIELIDKDAPIIELTGKTELIEGEEFDATAFISRVYDPQDGDLDYKIEGTVDTSQIGTYQLKISAEDKTKNKTIKDLEIVVKENLDKRIAEEAIKLVGVTNGWQCTEVATQSLINAGFNAEVMWPDEYVKYGYYTDNPKPGNLIYYNNGGRGVDHIAVYIGNGQAVHGNWGGTAQIGSGGITIIESVYVPGASYPQYIQIIY